MRTLWTHKITTFIYLEILSGYSCLIETIWSYFPCVLHLIYTTSDPRNPWFHWVFGWVGSSKVIRVLPISSPQNPRYILVSILFVFPKEISWSFQKKLLDVSRIELMSSLAVIRSPADKTAVLRHYKHAVRLTTLLNQDAAPYLVLWAKVGVIFNELPVCDHICDEVS